MAPISFLYTYALATVFPHIVSAETILFGNPKVTVHKGAETIQGRKLLKGGNYMRKYGIPKTTYLALGTLAKLMFWSILSFKNLQD